MENAPSLLNELEELYRASIRFRDIAPWKWMWDSDLFGVQDPETGGIGYSCIMGQLKEVFALAVYRGTEGLNGYLKMRTGDIHPMEILFVQNCLMASFEDRKDLEKKDLAVIKKLGLKIRGAKAWPLFRSYDPGYYPWDLDAAQRRFLNLALQQAVDVALRMKDDPGLLHPRGENEYLVRVSAEKGGERVWSDQWLKPKPVQEVNPVTIPMDEIRLQRIKNVAQPKDNVWEVDFFPAPMPVREGDERPYFPYLLVVADQGSGMVLAHHMAQQQNYPSEFLEEVLNAMEKIATLPKEIWVEKKETMDLFSPALAHLKIKVKRKKRLKALEDFMMAMMDFPTRR